LRIGYGKLGRTLGLTPESWGVVGGDDEAPLLLKTIAERWPEHTFVLLGRNSGEVPQDIGLPPNVENPFIELRDEIRAASAGNTTPMTLEQLYRTAPALIKAWLPTFDTLDGVIMWLGQHGTSNYPLTFVDGSGRVSKPQDSSVYYACPMIGGMNRWTSQDPHNRSVTWLLADPRNYIKCRDLAWPPRQVLAQFDYVKKGKHWRYRETGSPEDYGFKGGWEKNNPTTNIWHVEHNYTYSALELCGIFPEHIPGQFSDNWGSRRHFGLFVNETRTYVARNRLNAMCEYVMPLNPVFVHGKWTPKSRAQINEKFGYDIEPLPLTQMNDYYDLLRSVKSTFTMPSSGEGWATVKPWQSFATGTACFFHPSYDTQGHIIPTVKQVKAGGVPDDLAQLARWLRVESPQQLAKRVDALNHDRDAWSWLVGVQRKLYDQACEERLILRHIGRQAGLE
jgi:hypothetical protein